MLRIQDTGNFKLKCETIDMTVAVNQQKDRKKEEKRIMKGCIAF